MTGSASFLGQPEARTAEMMVRRINQTGGINGRKIQLILRDSASRPENAARLATQLVDNEKVLAIIGPSTSGETMAIKNICQGSRTILISCAAAESLVNPVADYVFKVAPKDTDAARLVLSTMKQRRIARIGIMVSNDSFGLAGKGHLEQLAADSGITVAASEEYDRNATDVSAVLRAIKAQQVQAVVNWSAVPAQIAVASQMKQVGLDVPLFQSHGFGSIACARAAGAVGEGTLVPGGRIMIADEVPDDHPQKAILMAYKRDYEKQYKEEVCTFGGYAHDAILVLTQAIRNAGSIDSEKVGQAIEGIRGLAGVSGIFNFSREDHNGLGIDAFELLTVKDAKFVVTW